MAKILVPPRRRQGRTATRSSAGAFLLTGRAMTPPEPPPTQDRACRDAGWHPQEDPQGQGAVMTPDPLDARLVEDRSPGWAWRALGRASADWRAYRAASDEATKSNEGGGARGALSRIEVLRYDAEARERCREVWDD